VGIIHAVPESSTQSTYAVGTPRALRLHQEKPPVPTKPPTLLKRAAGGGTTWGLPRVFSDYDATTDTGIGGKATKWVLRHHERQNDFYIAKFGNKNGKIEIFTELFNNQLGMALGFEMAHSGLARLDDNLYFITRNFREENERLVHGSLMVEQVFAAPKATEQIPYTQEQSFYTIDAMRGVIEAFCGSDSEPVFQHFVNMLIFDALIGCMDRHAQNWGVLQTTTEPARRRLAPIFDSARAFFWDIPDGRLTRYETNEGLFVKYIENSNPCIGPEPNHPRINECNHFDLVENLMKLYPHPTIVGLGKIPSDTRREAVKILTGFPFENAFSSVRKRLILRTLDTRAARLRQIRREGGQHAADQRQASST
jgi:HipA-like C-terminal domain